MAISRWSHTTRKTILLDTSIDNLSISTLILDVLWGLWRTRLRRLQQLLVGEGHWALSR